MNPPPASVLYLVGTTRCGSTLVGSLLGRIPGVVHVGELARIWEEGFILNYRCGCGAAFRECAFWRGVLDHAFRGREPVDPRRMIDVLNRSARTRHAVRLVTARGRERMLAGMEEYSDAMAQLYRAILAEAGARMVLDSSKAPLLAWVMSQRQDLDLRVLHLTRDPRAVAHSWQRAKYDPAKGKDMRREGPVRTSLGWLAWNGLAASIWDRSRPDARFLHVRYEDLTGQPHRVLDRILDWLDEPVRAAALIDPDLRYAGALDHTVAGNPMRFSGGKQRIAADTEWRTAGSRWDKLLVAGLTWPLLGRYGYPLLAGGGPDAEGARR